MRPEPDPATCMVITMERPLDRWRQLLYRRGLPVGTVLPVAR